MKGRKIITISIIINLILVGIVYNLIGKVNVNNKKQVIKEMSETEYEDYITSLNTSHEDYAKSIEESKKKIASAITDMGVTTSDKETLETMANNIKSIKSGRITMGTFTWNMSGATVELGFRPQMVIVYKKTNELPCYQIAFTCEYDDILYESAAIIQNVSNSLVTSTNKNITFTDTGFTLRNIGSGYDGEYYYFVI